MRIEHQQIKTLLCFYFSFNRRFRFAKTPNFLKRRRFVSRGFLGTAKAARVRAFQSRNDPSLEKQIKPALGWLAYRLLVLLGLNPYGPYT